MVKNKKDQKLIFTLTTEILSVAREKKFLSKTLLNSEFEISFVTKNVIKRLKKDFLDHDALTDVISFPAPAFYQERGFLGDVVICKDVAKQQAHEYGHSMEIEALILAIHGFLHLLGYDHIKLKDKMHMLKAEESILSCILGENQSKGLIARVNLSILKG